MTNQFINTWNKTVRQEEVRVDQDREPKYYITTSGNTTPIDPATKETMRQWIQQSQAPWPGKTQASLRTATDHLYMKALEYIVAIMFDDEIPEEEKAAHIGIVIANMYNAITNLSPEFAKQELARFTIE